MRVLVRLGVLCAYLSLVFRSLSFWFVRVFIVQLVSSAAGFLFSLVLSGKSRQSCLWWLPVEKFVVKFRLAGRLVFSSKGSGQQAGCPTPRAPDVWESARFRSIFLASGFFYISNIVHAHPHAGNANRWHAPCRTKVKKHHASF